MLSKSILKYIQNLHHKKFRDEHDVFVAEGTKVVIDLLVSGRFVCAMLCFTEEFYNEHEVLLFSVEAKNQWRITAIELQKISLLQTPNKVFAIFNRIKPGEVILKERLNLMLDDIQDPGNMGTIIRIADWFGIKNIICSNDCVDHYNPKVVQTSMGSIARVNVTYTDLKKFINNNKKINVYAATLNGMSLYSFNKITEGLLLIGNESKGVNNELLKLVKDQLTIPKFGGAESLNAAIAAGIILSHLLVSKDE